MTGLEAFEIIRSSFIGYKNRAEGKELKCVISPQFAQVRLELQALEIIKEKNVDVKWMRMSATLNEYNAGCTIMEEPLTQEEFYILKAVL